MDVKWTKQSKNFWTGTNGNLSVHLKRWPDHKEFSGGADYVDSDTESVVEVRVQRFAGVRVGLAKDYVVQEAKRQLEAMLEEFNDTTQ